MHRLLPTYVLRKVNQFDEHIRDGMAEGERLPTDPAVVYARVQELSQSYRQRRRLAQSAGSAVLGVGLIAGLVQMHGFLQGGTAAPQSTSSSFHPADPVPSSSRAAAVPSSRADPAHAGPPGPSRAGRARAASSGPAAGGAERRAGARELDAFFNAGYHWAQAEQLARLWNIEDPADAKIVAGRRLLAGQRLPVAPDGPAASD
ncbi:hypothetical protein [Paractinoplanes abujensis]|uniref:Uncharacterized protein n=1 Tax=Paractinoplanes abujensis TaxID=882441 RepID=A0A7W7CT61_9ACTN|nr:hypothetical protein [Actinoplanes abujensis]MBB4692900.1 hypothetical protein [Actinoplanes abujensis]